MERAYEAENQLMHEAVSHLREHKQLSTTLKDSLIKTFGERFTNGWELASARKVRRYEFKPGGRVVWAVKGRKSEYQVMPDIPFCYCDDYYFRVMDRKRGLCYHIIAQRIAEALDEFETVAKKDSQYSSITARWRAKEKSDKSEQD